MEVFGLKYEREVMVGEHKITLPEPPKSTDEILFFNLSEEDAYWKRRTDYPQVFYDFIPYETYINQEYTKYDDKNGQLVQVSVEDTNLITALYKDILKKRTEGVFIKNKDELIYFTGPYWFTLEFCRMFGAKGDGYGKHFDYQREIFYLLEYMWEEWIAGLYISKAKKTGITQIIDGGYCVEKATRESQWMIGFMSRNQNVAVENNMKLFLYAFDNLPSALKPKVGFKAAKGGNIEFTDAAKAKKISSNEVLETKVFCVPTAEHSFDSHFMNVAHMDEYPKYYQDSKKEPKEVFNGNFAGIKDQDVFRGRLIISSYPPEIDDIGSEQAAETYKNSKLSTKKNGRTITGLIGYHIPAYKSLKSCIDKYGKCDELKAKKILEDNRERVKGDKKAFLAEVRQNPNNEKEAFGSGGVTKCFDPVRLADLEYELDQKQRSGRNYIAGKYVWDNPLWEAGKKDKRPKGQFCKVNFIPATKEEIDNEDEGAQRIRHYQDIPAIYQNRFLTLGKDEWGNLNDPRSFYSVGAIDPTDYRSDANAAEGSKMSMMSMPIHDMILNLRERRTVTKIMNAVYFYRPANPEESYQDAVKFMLYHGCLIVVEANIAWMAERMEQEGLGHYMVFRDEQGNYARYKPNHDGKLRHIRTLRIKGGIDTVSDIVTFIQGYLLEADPRYNEIDYGALIGDERVIKQLTNFDKDDTKKFDLIITLGYVLILHNTYVEVLSIEQDNGYGDSEVNAVLNAIYGRVG